MSRQIRIQFPGALFHITSRGNEQRDVFLHDDDRRLFLSLLGDAVEKFKWIVTAYALMTNHFHILLELTVGSLSSGMQWLNGKYVKNFNKRHGRVGHLFQGRFTGKLVQKESYWQTLLRYVVLNPVRAGIVQKPGDYEWTSYRATAGFAEVPEWLDVNSVLRSFSDDRQQAQARYRRFVADSPGDRCPWDDLIANTFLGDAGWVHQVRERVDSRPRDSAYPRKQRRVIEWHMNDVLTSVATALDVDVQQIRYGRGGAERMLAAWVAANECLLPLASIAAGLRFRSAGHASRLVARCDERLGADDALRAAVDRCRRVLYAL